MLGRCSHEFSWPRRAADGHYYQVCLLCAVEYKYDWNTMKRVKRVDGESEMDSETPRGRIQKKPTWVPRARRLSLQAPLRYRAKGLGTWQRERSKTSASLGFCWLALSNCQRTPWWRWFSRCPRRFPARRTARYFARVASFAARKCLARKPSVWLLRFSTTSSCARTDADKNTAIVPT